MATASSVWRCAGEGREREGMRLRRVEAKVQATAAAALTFRRRGSCKRACTLPLSFSLPSRALLPFPLPFLLLLSVPIAYHLLCRLWLCFGSAAALPSALSSLCLQLCRHSAFTLPPLCLHSTAALCLHSAFTLPPLCLHSASALPLLCLLLLLCCLCCCLFMLCWS